MKSRILRLDHQLTWTIDIAFDFDFRMWLVREQEKGGKTYAGLRDCSLRLNFASFTFAYFCAIHPNMVGEVIVEEEQ